MRFSTRVLYFLIFIGFLLAACAKQSSEEITSARGPVPDEIIKRFFTQETDSGAPKWRLTAPTASRFSKLNLVILEKPHIEFYDEKSELQTVLTSDSGRYYQDERKMLAYGNVVVTSVDGDVLETDSLLWMNQEDRITTESFVKLTRGRDVLTGYGMECSHDLASVNIKSRVKAKIVDEKGEIKERREREIPR